jgi:hypothetical protein
MHLFRFYLQRNPKEYDMEISPDEAEIIGSWVMVNGRLTDADAGRRRRWLGLEPFDFLGSQPSCDT